MRHGVSIPNFAEPDRLLDVARAADAAGWDGFFLWDHIVADLASPMPISEPWTVLAAAASTTTRVRLGTLVTPVARRRPWVLARQMTTVDHLSAGRAVLGVGLGVPPEAEYAAFGEPSAARQHASMLDEGLQVIDALWSGERVAHEGPHYRVDGVQFVPRPIQRPRVPIWVAAALPARAGVRRAARWDGIVPIAVDRGELRPVTPDEVAAILDDVAMERGNCDGFDVVVWNVEPDRGRNREYAASGVTWLIEGPLPGAGWLDEALAIAHGGPPM